MARVAENVQPVPRWLANRIKVWQRRLKLDTWHLTIVFKQTLRRDNLVCRAFIEWAPGYKNATIYFSKEYYDAESEAEVDHTIVHELFHLISAREHDMLSDYIGSDSRVFALFVKENEQVADHCATLFTQTYSRKRALREG